MSVSIRHIAAAAVLAILGGGAAHAGGGSGCCGGGQGVVNFPPVVMGGGHNGGGAGCCGPATGHSIGVPNVFVPAPSVSVSTSGPRIGGVNIGVGGPVVGGVNVGVGGPTFIGGTTNVFGGGGGGAVYVGGGGGGFMSPAPTSPGMIDGLAIGGDERAQETVMETRTMTETVAIRAVCVDDRSMPHPASRLSGDAQIAPGADGEIFRCMAGTRMEVTIGRMVNGQAVFDGGRSLACEKGQALSYRGGQLVCTAQIARAACNERSLLRRFGPGIKYATITTTQQVAATRETTRTTSFRGSMFVDGGVGQGVY